MRRIIFSMSCIYFSAVVQNAANRCFGGVKVSILLMLLVEI